jgi:hypothetical protein
MDLEKLQKELYKPEAEFKGRPTAPETFAPGQAPQPSQPARQWQEAVSKKRWYRKIVDAVRFSYANQKKKWFWGFGIALAVLILGMIGFVYWYGLSSFDRSWVSLEITGPDRIVSGEDVVYIARYKNSTKTALNEVYLNFYWPENSLPESGNLSEKISVGTLGPGEKKEFQFKGKIIGLKGFRKEINVELSYQPAKVKSRFENKAVFSTEIISVPLVLSFDMPEKVSSGQQITASLKYLNDSETNFQNLAVKIEYPVGFKVSSTYPQPQENLWEIGVLENNQEGKILITGIVEGQRGDSNIFRAYLGTMKNGAFVSYAETVKAIQISLPILSLDMTVNDEHNYAASAGDYLRYKIKYQNNGQLGIPSVNISLKFDSKALDFSTLDLKEKGSFDGSNNTISWNQANASELEFLAPGQTGEFNFAIRVLENLPVKSFSDKNFTIYAVASSNSSNVPLALSNQQVSDSIKTETKINTRLGVVAKGYYVDSFLQNSGPLPPKIGQTTTYSIHWQITNISNDAENVRVEAILPAAVEWINKYSPSSNNFRYDVLNRKIIWEVGKLSAGTGVVAPAKYAVFQVALTPTAPQINQVVELLKQSKISGKDIFTESNLESVASAVLSDLKEDPTMSPEKGRVAK